VAEIALRQFGKACTDDRNDVTLQIDRLLACLEDERGGDRPKDRQKPLKFE
jgi:hypothetical protein